LEGAVHGRRTGGDGKLTDWTQLRRASVLNNPTDITLTFADSKR
jgi:hypothetical protein